MQLIPYVPGKGKSAILLDARWRPGRTITISFLDGEDAAHGRALQAAVQEVAEQWLTKTGARLSFQWRRDTTKTNIRISFRFAGSWSQLGTYALLESDATRPTMNFGWLNKDSSPQEIQQVVLHEFGHALGLIHEHSSPASTIRWNRDAVIAALSGPPNRWSVEKIKINVLQQYCPWEVRATPFDPASIMLYPVDKAWTLDGFETQPNTELSERDIALVREIYGEG